MNPVVLTIVLFAVGYAARVLWRVSRGLWRTRKTVTHVTPENPPMADTSSNGRQYRPPMEETEMFRTDRTDYIVLAALAFALVSTLFS